MPFVLIQRKALEGVLEEDYLGYSVEIFITHLSRLIVELEKILDVLKFFINVMANEFKDRRELVNELEIFRLELEVLRWSV